MRKLISALASIALGAGLMTAPAFSADKGMVGISMPTKSFHALDLRRREHGQELQGSRLHG